MKLFKKILYVTEETADQASAIERAVSLAENNQAKLTVINVIPPVPDDYRADTISYHMKALESLIEPHQHRLKIQIDVWLMKPPEKPKYERVLAAVDFDPLKPATPEQPLNMKILELAGAIALTDGASLHLAHAWQAYAETAMRVSSDISNKSIIAHTENQYQLHQKRLYSLGETLRGMIGADAYDRLSPRFHLPKEPPKKMIAALAAELQVDLVVMGTVARTGISGLIIGNTAETILDQLSCSVLAVKPPGFTTPVKLGA